MLAWFMSLTVLQSIQFVESVTWKPTLFQREGNVLHSRGNPRENIRWRLAVGINVFGHCV